MPIIRDKRLLITFSLATALLFAAMVNIEVRSFYEPLDTSNTYHMAEAEDFETLEHIRHTEEFDEYLLGYEITVMKRESGGYDLYAFEIEAFATPLNEEREWARKYSSLETFHIEGRLQDDRHFLLGYEEMNVERKERDVDVSIHPMHILGYENIADSSGAHSYDNHGTCQEEGRFLGTFEYFDAHSHQSANTHYIVAVPAGTPFEHTVRICGVFEHSRAIFGPMRRTSTDRVRLLHEFAHDAGEEDE